MNFRLMIVVRMGLSYFTIFCSSIRCFKRCRNIFHEFGKFGVFFVELCIVKDIQNSSFSVMEEINLIYKFAGKSMRLST